MKGKSIIILGGTDGIGNQVARFLVAQNQVIIVGRNKQKGEAFVQNYAENANFLQADLSLLTNVKKLAEDIIAEYQQIDIIIHTADMLSMKSPITSEGQPSSIVVNYYSRVLFNHLLLKNERYSIERIIHVALAGKNPGKNYERKFPTNENTSGFTSHQIGQASNDFYGLYLASILRENDTKINILNPGLVNTDIRKKGEVPAFLKLIWPAIEFMMTPFMTEVKDYAKVVLSIIYGENEAANQQVLIDPKGKPITPNAQVNNKELQNYVWQETWKIIAKNTGFSYKEVELQA